MHRSSVEKNTPTVQKKQSSSDQDSPESPFEVLGDLKQVNEFEETEEWMKTHLPPVPSFDAVDLIKDTLASDGVASKETKKTDIVPPDASLAGVPDAFMDSPIVAPKVKDDSDIQMQPRVEEEEEEPEFDLSFLPTAYMWDQQEKSGVQGLSNPNAELPASCAPPKGFGSPSPPGSPPDSINIKHRVSCDKKDSWAGDLDPPEASEAESSGESDDTVIEDGAIVPVSSAPSDSTPVSASPDVTAEVKETPQPKSERKLMQVPTINVIETDDPNYSEEEMEMETGAEEDEVYDAIKNSASEPSKTPELEPEDNKTEPPMTRPLETEFMEGYSPPSSPVDSDAEYSPKHKILKPLPETVCQVTQSEPQALPSSTVSEDSTAQKSQANDELPHFTVANDEVDFPDNDDEWSDDGQSTVVPFKPDVLSKEPFSSTKMDEKSNTYVKEKYVETPCLSKTSFMQDDIYDRQSFDYDFDSSSSLDNINDKELSAKERFLSDAAEVHIEKPNANAAKSCPEDKESPDDFTFLNYDKAFSKPKEYAQEQNSSFQSETLSFINKEISTGCVSDNIANSNSVIQQDTNAAATTSIQEATDPDSSVSEPTDSFVEFMRECLKSRQDEEPGIMNQSISSNTEFCKTDLPPSHYPPTMVMDLEQEQLTISALKELGSSQEEEEEVVSDQDKPSPNATTMIQSSITSDPKPPCSHINRAYDSTYSKEVEAIDEWVAEAYHLAEHILTAILTHLSGNIFSFWQ